MKLSFPITKEKIKTHFTYAWWQYVLLISLAIFGWNLLYTTTHYRSPENLKVEWYYSGYVAEAEESIDELVEQLHRTIFKDMEEVTFTPVVLDDTYGSMQLMAWTSAGQGDLFIMPKDYFTSLASGEGTVELTPYIESGELKADGLDLKKGYVMDSETGVSHLMGIPAAQLPGLARYGLTLEDEYVCVSVNCGNVENAMKLLCWLAENMRE